jgi:hypothetical protein
MRVVLLSVLALALSACPGDPAPPESLPAPVADSGMDTGQTPLGCGDIGRLLRGCSASICHHQGRREGDLSLDFADPLGPQIAAELISVPAAYSVADRQNCPDPRELRVDPDDIDDSLLLKKLDGRFGCGEMMPNVELPEWTSENRPASLACVRAWLVQLVAANRSR